MITTVDTSNILSFLNNVDSRSFICSSRYFNAHGRTHGWMDSISLECNDDCMEFIKRCCEQKSSLRSIHIQGIYYIEDASLYLVVYPKCMSFTRVGDNLTIEPVTYTITESLHINSYYTLVKIDWSKFRNLKYLILRVNKFNKPPSEIIQSLEIYDV
jgi:hypothetical protein